MGFSTGILSKIPYPLPKYKDIMETQAHLTLFCKNLPYYLFKRALFQILTHKLKCLCSKYQFYYHSPSFVIILGKYKEESHKRFVLESQKW